MESFVVRLPIRLKGPLTEIILPNANIKAVLRNESYPNRCNIVVEDGEKYCVPYRADTVANYVFGGVSIPQGTFVDPISKEDM